MCSARFHASAGVYSMAPARPVADLRAIRARRLRSTMRARACAFVPWNRSRGIGRAQLAVAERVVVPRPYRDAEIILERLARRLIVM
jgi:hypothetical protein